MGELEKRFFSCKRRTIIKPGDKDAAVVAAILKKALTKGECGGRPGYSFKFHNIY